MFKGLCKEYLLIHRKVVCRLLVCSSKQALEDLTYNLYSLNIGIFKVKQSLGLLRLLPCSLPFYIVPLLEAG